MSLTVLIDYESGNLHSAQKAFERMAAEVNGGEILVSTLRDGEFVTIRVTDTGAGIPEEQAARVLEPYFSTKKGGTGLGLPTVRRVAEEHGGTLSLQSDRGKGTQFMLRLPIRGAEPTRAKE